MHTNVQAMEGEPDANMREGHHGQGRDRVLWCLRGGILDSEEWAAGR